MRSFRCQSLSRDIVALLSATLLILWGFPAYAVAISTPKENSTVKGIARIAATTDKGDERFAYAVLLVDNERHSIGNVQPLRFEVDTANLTDGAHLLQVQLFDLAGVLSRSKAVNIIVDNTLPSLTGNSPTPTEATPPVNLKAQPVSLPVRYANLTVVMNEKPMQVEPFIRKGRTMVLLRPLIEALGGELSWDAVKMQATAVVEGRRYCFTIGKNAVTVNGEKKPIARPSAIFAGRTVVPVTIWRDLFDGDIQYDNKYRCITLDYRARQSMPETTIASIR